MKATIIRHVDAERINASQSGYYQNPASLAGLPDGGWLATWTYSGDVYQQRFDAKGEAAGPHSQVYSGQFFSAFLTKVTVLADGGWVVTWQSSKQSGSNFDIYQQRFDTKGQKVGSETLVSTYRDGNTDNHQVAALADGGWVITWVSDKQKGTGRDVYQQRYTAEGEAKGGEIRVNPYEVGEEGKEKYEHDQSSVTALPDGGWLVTWRSRNMGDPVEDRILPVFQQRYNAEGEIVGGATLVNSGVKKLEGGGRTSVTTLADGGWVVTWVYVTEKDVHHIYQRRYDKDGIPDPKGEHEVSTTTGTRLYPGQQNVTALADGGWTVSWAMNWREEFGQSDFHYAVYQQSFDKDGNAVGPETVIDNGRSTFQDFPSLAALADGGWVTAWKPSTVDGLPSGLMQQRFKSVEAFGEGKEQGTGTSGNDVFGVLDHGLNVGDSLEAGAGTDTLKMVEAGTLDLTAPSVLEGIEIVQGSNLNDIIIANEDRIDGIRDFRGGNGYDSLQLRAGDYDFTSKAVSGIEAITLLGTGSITFSSKSMALWAQSYTRDGAVTLTEGRFTIAERTKLYNQGIRKVTDEGGVYNLQQSQVSLSTNGVTENALAGTGVATLSATDPNPGDGLSFELIDSAGGRFAISGNQLVVADSSLLDYETGASHRVVVRIVDEGGIMTDAAFTITLNDVPVEIIRGTSRADVLKGGTGNDVLFGGAGKDTLTGDAGQDIFAFDTKPNTKTNRDKITDFNVKDDAIWLDNKVFAKLGKKGSEAKPAQLKKDFFTLGSKAKDKNDYLIYDSKKGVLYYDADGSGTGKAVEIATLSKKLKMTHKDFFVI